MKLFVTIILALAIAVGVALISMDDPGYVVLTRDPYVVRLPLLLFAVFLFLGFMLLYLLFNLIAGIFRAPKRFGKWREQSNENSAQKNTMLGYAGLIEGNWEKAEGALLTKLEHNKTPLMNLLGAAYAAQQQGHLARRDQYLDEALQKNPKQAVAINLTRARLNYQAGEISESRNLLEDIRRSASKNVPAVRLLADVYNDLGDWSSLIALVPAMKKLKAFAPEDLEQREQNAYERMLSSPALLQGEQERPENTWNSLPSAKRKDPAVIANYVAQLVKGDRLNDAESMLRKALKKNYSSELMTIYGTVKSPELDNQIKLVESLGKKRGDDPALQLALARLFRFKKNWDKSQAQYAKVMEMGGGEEAYLEYASLLEQMGEQDSALVYMKKGVAQLVKSPESEPPQQGEIVAVEDGSAANVKDVMPAVR